MNIEQFTIDGQFALFQLCNNQIHILNSTAQFIWEQTLAGSSNVEIACELVKTFSITKPQALTDIHNCQVDWKQKGLLSSQGVTTQRDCSHPLPATIPSHTNWHNVRQIEIADTPLELAIGSAQLELLLAPILEHLTTRKSANSRHRICVWEDDNGAFVSGKQCHFCSSQDQIIESLIHEVIECSCRDRNFWAILHAGAVLYNDLSILLAGSGGSGKSTLITALQYHGYPYLSDDISPLEKETGMLVPFPMSQSLKTGSWAPLQDLYPLINQLPSYQRLEKQVRYLVPQHVKANSWQKHWPIGALIFPCFDPQSKPGFKQLSSLQALQHLLLSQSLYDLPVQYLVAWLEALPCYIMHYHDLKEGTDIFKQIMCDLGH